MSVKHFNIAPLWFHCFHHVPPRCRTTTSEAVGPLGMLHWGRDLVDRVLKVCGCFSWNYKFRQRQCPCAMRSPALNLSNIFLHTVQTPSPITLSITYTCQRLHRSTCSLSVGGEGRGVGNVGGCRGQSSGSMILSD